MSAIYIYNRSSVIIFATKELNQVCIILPLHWLEKPHIGYKNLIAEGVSISCSLTGALKSQTILEHKTMIE